MATNMFNKEHARVWTGILVAIATVGVALAQEAKVSGTLDGHTDPVYSVTWSPDGKTLATAGFDNTVRLWDAVTRKEIKKYEGHAKLVLAVAIAPNGKQILSGSLDNLAKIWDYPTPTGPRIWRTARGVQALAVKPDGKQFVTAAGKSAKVWDVASGALVKDLPGHAGDVLSAGWRGDGSQLATADKVHSIRLWKADLTSDGRSKRRLNRRWDWFICPTISNWSQRAPMAWHGSGSYPPPYPAGLTPRDRSPPST